MAYCPALKKGYGDGATGEGVYGGGIKGGHSIGGYKYRGWRTAPTPYFPISLLPYQVMIFGGVGEW